MKLAPTTKQYALWGLTGLALAYVGHGLQTNWARWTPADFVFQWLGSVVLLMPLVIVVALAHERFHEFFVGYKRKSTESDDLLYSILMTLLIAAVGVAFVHWADTP